VAGPGVVKAAQVVKAVLWCAMRICTIATEYNYSSDQSQLGSLWMFSGDGTETLKRATPMEHIPGWTCIISKIDYAEACKVAEAIKGFLENAGVTVIEQGIAD
jgi:hypothetical protein